MPEYLSPGVYVEEFEIGARPIEGVSTSTAGFLGLTERGPTGSPQFITSMTQFMRVFGSYISDSYLTYAVNGFFTNGGQRCFVGRIVREGAESSSFVSGSFTFTAVGEGSWGNRVAFRIENASNDPENANPDGNKLYKLTIAYWSKNFPEDFTLPELSDEKKKRLREITESATTIEVFDNLSENPDSLNNLSNLVVLSGSGRPSNTDSGVFYQPLENGIDASDDPPLAPTRDDFLGNPAASPGNKKGLTAFTDIDEISIIYVPDMHFLTPTGRRTLIDDILTHCEIMKDRFAVLDVPVNINDMSNLKITTQARSSKYGAIYYPWIKIYDPLSGQNKLIPPGGHVTGIYARTDTERGIHKAPANELIRGAIGLEFTINKGEQALLNPRGINVIRSFPGRGILVWGARTMILDPLWKYINVRRLFLYIEESIDEGTQWVVFEPNDEKLWGRVRATVTEFLNRVWRDGALMGQKADEAFFVKCDRTTMTQDDIDNGRLICVIGVAPVKPAEFVIFKIAQWTAGASGP